MDERSSWVWEGKPWEAFKSFAIIFSFVLNFILLIVLLLLATSLHMVPAFIIDSVLILPQECLNPSILTAQNHSDMYMLFGIYFPFLTAAHLSTPFMIAL